MLCDSNHDARFERRLDEVRVGETIEATEHLDAGRYDGGAPGFVVSRAWVRPASSEQGRDPNCRGDSNFPSETAYWQGGSSPGFSDHPNVKCNLAQRKKLGAGFECALKRLDCVGRTNASLKKQVEAHLINDDLQYGCNNPCEGQGASTVANYRFDIAQTNFNGKALDSWTPDQACSIVLHQLLHTAKAEVGPNHNDGTDMVYSCARYCVGCIHYGGNFLPGEFPSDTLDCVRCAETESDKKRCGLKNELVTSGYCPGNAFCHGDSGVNTLCETCDNIQRKDCDGNPVGVPYFSCCKSCPANARVNDRPCPVFTPSETCTEKPPECR